MTLTRSQRGITPRKTERPGYVETPTRRRTARKSTIPLTAVDTPEEEKEEDVLGDEIEVVPEYVNGKAQQQNEYLEIGKLQKGRAQNGHATRRHQEPKVEAPLPESYTTTHQVHEFEFGGPLGVSAIMIGFPLLMYYMWIGATYYDGKFPRPTHDESIGEFVQHLGRLVYEGAFPHAKAWAMYWIFFVTEGAFYVYMPGVKAKGKPLPHEGGRQMEYHCSGLLSWYATIAIAVTLHISGLFPMYTILDEFGPLMSVAILSGFLVSVVVYMSALYRGVQHRMTGNHIYDFFMGAELNPRILGILDFKMFFEVRIPWFILFLTTLSAAARQYEQFGYVSGELGFLLMAHWLYTNACAKAEEMIVTTWDMYYEKLGFMLTFWNLAGVPLSYCHCTLYLANHAPSVYHWNKYALGALYVTYIFVYWIWDSANGQKNRYRHQENGGYTPRQAFPQVPWAEVHNPRILKTEKGETILVDGWYRYARKIHYTCDAFFAISWGLVAGFKSPFPWFYPVFFCCMITHRAMRDIQRCRERYGDAWRQYEKQTPYLFIPYLI